MDPETIPALNNLAKGMKAGREALKRYRTERKAGRVEAESQEPDETLKVN